MFFYNAFCTGVYIFPSPLTETKSEASLQQKPVFAVERVL